MTDSPRHRATNLGKGLLDGLGYIATKLADSGNLDRIKEIDAEIALLKQERNHLIKGLIEPGDLKVDEDVPLMDKFFGKKADAGRLTKCKGSWRDNDPFDKSHPGCPYRKTQHTEHEFTLRD